MGLDARAPDLVMAGEEELGLRKRKASGWGGWEIQLLPQGGWHEAREVEVLGKDPLGGGCEFHLPHFLSLFPPPTPRKTKLGVRQQS